MNSYQTKLFTDLMALCASNEAFFFKDSEFQGGVFRVFTYRLASYSDFLIEGARECRGIMFQMNADGTPNRIACLTPPKFFNLGENPLTIGIDLNADTVDGIMDKRDGSIISTFVHEGELFLKSKTSLFSEHVEMATEWLNNDASFKKLLLYITTSGYSVHMELTSPTLRIVLGYEDIQLTILSIRNIHTGKIITIKNVAEEFGVPADGEVIAFLKKYWVHEFMPEDIPAFVASVPAMTGVEGFVYRMKDGAEHIKQKCDWYCTLHHVKDSISSPRRLFECVINEAADDTKAMFSADPITLQRIYDMETKVTRKFNNIIVTVEAFYEENKGLERKEYAIKAQGQDDGLMGLKMSMFLKRPIDYKEFALKHMEMFDVNKDEVYETVDE